MSCAIDLGTWRGKIACLKEAYLENAITVHLLVYMGASIREVIVRILVIKVHPIGILGKTQDPGCSLCGRLCPPPIQVFVDQRIYSKNCEYPAVIDRDHSFQRVSRDLRRKG